MIFLVAGVFCGFGLGRGVRWVWVAGGCGWQVCTPMGPSRRPGKRNDWALLWVVSGALMQVTLTGAYARPYVHWHMHLHHGRGREGG